MPVMEDIERTGPQAAAKAMAVEGTLRRIHQIEARRFAGAWDFLESLRRDTAMRGLAIAIPMTLSVWAMIGLLFWALTR